MIITNIEGKVCSKCGTDRPLSDFYRQKRGKMGRTARCKLCYKRFYVENRDKIKEYYAANRAKILKNAKQNYIDNGDSIRAYNKQYKLDHKQEISAYNRKYWLEHKGKKDS